MRFISKIAIYSLACATPLMTWAQNSLTTSSSTMEQLVIRDIALCDERLFAARRDEKDIDTQAYQHEWERLQARMQAAADPKKPDNPGALRGSWKVDGLTFNEVTFFAAFGSAGSVSWSAQAKLSDFESLMSRMNLKLKERTEQDSRGEQTRVWQAARFNQEQAVDYFVHAGRINLDNGMKPQTPIRGHSLVCVFRSPNAEEQAQMGTPSVEAIGRAIQSGERQTVEWIDTILKRGSPAALEAVTRYKYLSESQIQSLLEKAMPSLMVGLVSNNDLRLDRRHVNLIARQGDLNAKSALINRYLAMLDAEAILQIERVPSLKSQFNLASGGEAGLEELKLALSSADIDGIHRAMYYAKLFENDPARSAMIDLILEKAPLPSRQRLSMDSRFVYNAAQIERMLNDSDRQIRVGVLRRDELKIPAHLVSVGLNHSDKDLAFWYTQRKEVKGSAEQLEQGLTHPDGPTRAGWILDKRNSLSAQQMARALSDTAETVVWAALSRHDALMTDEQLDACVKSSSVSIRFGCVQRPEFRLTYTRWLAMASDWNSNTWGFHVKAHPSSATAYDTFFENSLQSATYDQLKAIAENKQLNLSAAQVLLGSKHSNPRVREVFCGRDRAICR